MVLPIVEVIHVMKLLGGENPLYNVSAGTTTNVEDKHRSLPYSHRIWLLYCLVILMIDDDWAIFFFSVDFCSESGRT